MKKKKLLFVVLSFWSSCTLQVKVTIKFIKKEREGLKVSEPENDYSGDNKESEKLQFPKKEIFYAPKV
jgi:hypothetical protein